MLIEKYNQCPWRTRPHSNLAYAVYTNGSYCYSCNKGVFKDRSFIRDDVRVFSQLTEVNCKLPNNVSCDISRFPLHILNWLYNFYIYKPDIMNYDIMYCPYEEFSTRSGVVFKGESLIFPIKGIGNEITGFQRRFFPVKQFFSYNLQNIICEFGVFKESGTVVLVEDYISAIRVGNLENCIWLKGVNLGEALITYLSKNYLYINIWLDGDDPGQRAANKIMTQLTSFFKKEAISQAFAIRESRTIKNLVTKFDPKCYSNNEMKEILNK